MLTQEEIESQYQLLRNHRNTLAVYVQQLSQLGSIYTPPAVVHGINESCQNICRIKSALITQGVAVDDEPNDDFCKYNNFQELLGFIRGENTLSFDEIPSEINANPRSRQIAPNISVTSTVLEKLKQVLTQEDTILFIGSGISTWSGLPSWAQLIEELAEFVELTGANTDLIRSEAQKGDLLQAISYGFDTLSSQQIGEFIRAVCCYGKATPHEIHQKIISLGPRCFVTTNYDDLIEQSLRKWQPDRFFRSPITNRHLTETANIVHARAIDFVFKPHGDAADSESIILTREQYRHWLSHGERHMALEALKTLLASRPVVYLGFNFRDPDFPYIRELLANTYKGGQRDHYAIMADISPAESTYWLRHYGLHLVSYSTTECPDNTRDHTDLLTLLNSLTKTTNESPAITSFDPYTSETVLTLARYAATLARTPKQIPEFQTRVHATNERRMPNESSYWLMDTFDGCLMERFLDDGPERALLIGLPGAGKTYSLRRSTARLAEKLHEACLFDSLDKHSVVPILADLKLYQGNLTELVSQTLPKNLPFDELIRHFKVKIFLDSFNELPGEYWDNGHYESDFSEFLAKSENTSLIVSSRTTDGLGKFDLRTYNLDEIERTVVITELRRFGLDLEGRFQYEVLRLLQRPFYFQYLTRGWISLPNDAHPRDFYQSLLKHVQISFSTRFNDGFDLEKALALIAYNTLNKGEETFPLSELLLILKTNLEAVGLEEIDAQDVANWLVSISILIPYRGGRVAFVHQSVTEYLACTELARRYQSRPSILKEKLSLTRWDQALFLTLSLLPISLAETFLQDIIKADLALALNAAKYLEIDRDNVVSKLLAEIPKRLATSSNFGHKIRWAIQYVVPISDYHEPQLHALIEQGGIIGAAAASRLIALKGASVKDQMLELLVERYTDYNLCENGIGPALRPFATSEDIKKIAIWADLIYNKVMPASNDEIIGFVAGAATFLSRLNISQVWEEFLGPSKQVISDARAWILCDLLRDYHSTDALTYAGELLLRGVDNAAITIYFIANFAKLEDSLSWDYFSNDHVVRLVEIINDPNNKSWGLKALTCLCSERSDLAEMVNQVASQKSGLTKATLLSCVTPNDHNYVFQTLIELLHMNDEERRQQPLELLEQIELDWMGNEDLFVQLLKLRDKDLASALFGGSAPPTITNLGTLDIGAINWWMEWMLEFENTSTNAWFLNQLGSLFASHLNPTIQSKFVTEFNKSDSKFRRLLADTILVHRNDITTDVFSEDAISFLLADLSRGNRIQIFRGHLLGYTATEQFITERLIPLLSDASPALLKNLKGILERAGLRHGRRYILK